MSDAIHGNTQLGVTKQDLIASIVQRELAFASKLLPTITDVSRFSVAGSKSISFPKLSSFAVTKRTEGSQGDASVITATNDQLLLNQFAYIAWIVDAITEKQSNISVQAELAARAASAHGRQVDTDIIAELTNVASLSVNGVVPADVTNDNVLDMVEYVESKNAILSDCVFVATVDQKKALLKLAEFSKNDVYGSPVIMTGQIGYLYGVPLIIHNGVGTTQQMFIYEKSACVIGFQSQPQMDNQPANEFGVGAKRYAMDQLYGIKGQQIAVGVAAGKSPLVAKLKD
jgi:hypothetical protein